MKVRKPKNYKKGARRRTPKKGLKAKAIHLQKPHLADIIREVVEERAKGKMLK